MSDGGAEPGTAGRPLPRRSDLVAGLRAVTFDFGNTLVDVGREDLAAVVARMRAAVDERSGPFPPAAFDTAWAEERVRQFAEEVPAGREVDLEQRVTRVLARLRGMAPPPSGQRWDDTAAARLADPSEVAWAVGIYSATFVETLPPPPGVGPLLARLAGRFALGIVSNWPLAATIDRYVEAAGWEPYLRAVVVSQRVGAIKPRPEIFAAAEAALGWSGRAILHVGDDWAADVVGAKRAGWRAGYLHGRPADSPLPGSRRTDDVVADLELDRLGDLGPLLGV